MDWSLASSEENILTLNSSIFERQERSRSFQTLIGLENTHALTIVMVFSSIVFFVGSKASV